MATSWLAAHTHTHRLIERVLPAHLTCCVNANMLQISISSEISPARNVLICLLSYAKHTFATKHTNERSLLIRAQTLTTNIISLPVKYVSRWPEDKLGPDRYAILISLISCVVYLYTHLYLICRPNPFSLQELPTRNKVAAHKKKSIGPKPIQLAPLHRLPAVLHRELRMSL